MACQSVAHAGHGMRGGCESVSMQPFRCLIPIPRLVTSLSGGWTSVNWHFCIQGTVYTYMIWLLYIIVLYLPVCTNKLSEYLL